MNWCGFFGFGGCVDLLDLGLGSFSDGLILVVFSWGVLEELRIEMFYGIIILVFKVWILLLCWVEFCEFVFFLVF